MPMHFYWRVIEELKYLGEMWTFHDPTFQRHFIHWLRRKEEVLAMSAAGHATPDKHVFKSGGTIHSLN